MKSRGGQTLFTSDSPSSHQQSLSLFIVSFHSLILTPLELVQLI